MTLPVWELSSLTWAEIRDLDRSRAVAVLPVGAIEAHGPHLPLGTDVIIAEAMARAGAERLARRGHPVLLLPPLAFTAAPFAAGFPGTVSVRPDTVAALVDDVARGLAAHGLRVLALANAHVDPSHIEALHRAVDAVNEAGDAVVVFPDITRRPWGSRLTAEFKSGACHAGQYESSVVLAVRPELVKDSVRRALPPLPRSLSDAMREGKRTFEEAGGHDAYFGDPAAASAEEGLRTIQALGSILDDAVAAVFAERDSGVRA